LLGFAGEPLYLFFKLALSLLSHEVAWRRRGEIEPRPMVSTRAMELETAKEILAEVSTPSPARWRR